MNFFKAFYWRANYWTDNFEGGASTTGNLVHNLPICVTVGMLKSF